MNEVDKAKQSIDWLIKIAQEFEPKHEVEDIRRLEALSILNRFKKTIENPPTK
jgi:hypothetical protein